MCTIGLIFTSPLTPTFTTLPPRLPIVYARAKVIATTPGYKFGVQLSVKELLTQAGVEKKCPGLVSEVARAVTRAPIFVRFRGLFAQMYCLPAYSKFSLLRTNSDRIPFLLLLPTSLLPPPAALFAECRICVRRPNTKRGTSRGHTRCLFLQTSNAKQLESHTNVMERRRSVSVV